MAFRSIIFVFLAVAGGVSGLSPSAVAAPVTLPSLHSRSAYSHSPSRFASALRVRGGQAEMSAAGALVTTVVPSLGVVLCNALYFTPLTAALQRAKAGSLGSLNPLPAALTVLANVAWLSYGN